jgi:L-amino acid N-acyltransferase YncA
MTIGFRAAEKSDSKLIWHWRNDPVTRSMSRQTDEVPLADHEKWFAQSLVNEKRTLWMVLLAGKPIGVVRFDKLEGRQIEISINLTPEIRGKSLGGLILSQASQEFQATQMADEETLIAAIRFENIASVKSFEKAGYKLQEKLDQDWGHYIYTPVQ